MRSGSVTAPPSPLPLPLPLPLPGRVWAVRGALVCGVSGRSGTTAIRVGAEVDEDVTSRCAASVATAVRSAATAVREVMEPSPRARSR
ncbi:hypothetical protein [Streptomyces sp. T21Q-yed]|uniref:hypothetical protein n=1 Tax=Streptomyces sp. T21Q-yed TaxID=3018441 RepID=UPI0023DFABCB|nr:hypothetical protein [Streptomyces sp. T21Q-yed]MDF3149347.1 hypothetical protein [Streptomyces sp. T21Q-yed]